MAFKHRILTLPSWPNRLAEPSGTDLKSATPPAISSPDYVNKLEAALTPEETSKLQELDPNDTVSEARLLARSSSTPPSPAALLKDRENSTKNSSSSSDVSPETIRASKYQNRICLDPQMHPNQSHVEVHHPGLLPLADFCDSGVEAAPEAQPEIPQKSLLDRFWRDLAADDDKDHPPELQSNPPIHPRGRVFRALTGGDICVEPVDVSGHFHAGHAPILKVRPAPGVLLAPQQPQHHGHRDPVSKLGPALREPFNFTSVDTDAEVKHQPSDYWGFSSRPGSSDGLEEVHLGKAEPPSAGVNSVPKSNDNYGPPQLASQDPAHSLNSEVTGRERASRSGQDSHVRHKDPEAEGLLNPLDLSKVSTEGRKEPDSASSLQKRTAHWLRDLLHHPDTYSSKLTQLPDKTPGRRNTSPGNVLWGYQKVSSTAPAPTRHSVDHHYKATIKDLENIMSNAVQLAKEAMEHLESTSTKASSGVSVRDSQHQRHRSDQSGAEVYKRSGQPNCNLMIPVPQRISSLLRLGEILDRKVKMSSGAESRSSDKSRHFPRPTSPVRDTKDGIVSRTQKSSAVAVNHCPDAERYSLDGTPSDVVNFSTQYNLVQAAADNIRTGRGPPLVHTHTQPLGAQDIELQERDTPASASRRPGLNLRGRSHVSLRGVQGFSLARSHPRQPIARDWSDARKRYVASVACISTALIGVLVGIYAGLVPSIQYYIVDLNHYAILGNVVFYFGLAVPSFFFWPLPLLHGRKPYILSSLVVAMPLLFPQAIAVNQIRSPYTSQWR